MRHLLALLLCLAFAGCAVGPNYRRPLFPLLPVSWQSAPVAPTAPVPDTEWWAAFHDPILDTLIATALLRNADLKIAHARIKEARGARLTAFANLLPNVDATTSLRKGNTGSGAGNISSYLFEGGFDATWELDIFGGGRRAAEAATATLESRKASANQVQVSLITEVVRNYLEYRRIEHQLELTRENLAAQQETFEVVRAQQAEGVADLLDVSRIETQTEQTEAEIPELESNLVTVRGTIGILLGDMPEVVSIRLSRGSMPTVSGTVALHTPASIIANRPDVMAAEHDLATATANQGVAMSNWFPKVSLSGLLGFQTGKVFGNIDTWSYGGTIRLPFIDFGRVRGLVQQADARQAIALATYEQTVVSAVHDVESSFTAYVKSQQRLERLEKAAAASRLAEEISRVHYKEGLNSLLDVLVAQQKRLEAESSLNTARATVGQRYAALYKALGIGFTPIK